MRTTRSTIINYRNAVMHRTLLQVQCAYAESAAVPSNFNKVGINAAREFVAGSAEHNLKVRLAEHWSEL